LVIAGVHTWTEIAVLFLIPSIIGNPPHLGIFVIELSSMGRGNTPLFNHSIFKYFKRFLFYKEEAETLLCY